MLVLKRFARISIYSVKVVYLFLSLGLLTLLTYFFEYPLLRNPLHGNDSGNVYQMIVWMDKFWPRIPLWYPLQGGGVSFIQGYPTLYQNVVLWFSHTFNFNLISSMAVINFSVVLLTCFGVYFFVLLRFKNQTAALIAGIFLLLSPMINIWIDVWGFLAQTFSYIFVAPALIMYDGYITKVLNSVSDRKKIFFLTGTVFFSVLATLAHPSTGVGLGVTYFLYGILLSVFYKTNASRVKNIVQVLKAVFFVALIWGLCVSFWFIPFYRYTLISNYGFNFFTSDPKTFPPVDLLPTLGFHKPLTQYAFPDLSLTMLVSVFIFVGFFVGLMRNKKLFTLSLLVLCQLFLIGSLSVVIFLTKFAPTLVPFIDMRTVVPVVIVLAPVTAGLGLVGLVKLLLSLVSKLLKKIRISSNNFLFDQILKPLIVVGFNLALLVFALFYFNDKTAFKTSDRAIYYGPQVRGIRIDQPWVANPKERCVDDESFRSRLCDYPSFVKKIDVNTFSYFCDLYANEKDRNWMCSGSKPPKGTPIQDSDVSKFLEQCKERNLSDQMEDLCLSVYKTTADKLNPLHWPKLHIATKESFSKSVNNFASSIKELAGNDVKRIDISPSLGNLVKNSGLQNDISIMNVYTGQLTISKPFNGVLRQVVNSEGIEVEGRLDEVTKSYGLEAVYLDSADKQDAYKNAGWTSYKLGSGVLWVPKKSFGIASIASKPLALQIGNLRNSTYEQVYKGAISGILPYEKFWLVEGKEKIDDYSLGDLKNFQVLILHGYSYSNKETAWKILKSYVESGGRVFIDTGWKYIDKDWGKGSKEKGYSKYSLPDPSPVSETIWSDVGRTWGKATIVGSSFKQVRISKFAPPIWEGQPWEMSLAEKDNLRENSYPILEKDGKVIVAGRDFGQGKIVWSGMNSFPHAVDKNSEEEFKFLKIVFQKLTEGLSTGNDEKVSFNRDNPDKIIFDIADEGENRSLYWREYNYPDWKAKFVNSSAKETSLAVLRSGPRMSLIPLPNESGKVIFQYEKPFLYYFADFLTIFGLGWLILTNLDFWFFEGRINNRFANLFRNFFQLRLRRLRSTLEEEE